MNYIVFDLEWNQNPNTKMKINKLLPFEIIEIGAIKLDENRQPVDTFHRLIKPVIYHWIQDSIYQVIHVNYRELQRKGIPFADAAEEFMEWCGDDYRFCTWAKQDVMELQRNMRYYHMLDLLPGPVVYYDVQKLHSLSFEDGLERRSLEHAIEQLGIIKDQGFHRALSDAVYTSRVLMQVDEKYLTGYESVDSYQNPKEKEDEFIYVSGGCEKYISREFANREKAAADREVKSTHCPVCNLKTTLPPGSKGSIWNLGSSRVYYSLTACPEHGTVAGRIRIRKTEQNRYYAVKTLWVASEREEIWMRQKIEALYNKKNKV
ncbi:MAG: exonuclease domain-containing protein [Blautia sp.]|nr:exonuclease domain-containing protein [Blautia sp.]